MTETSAANRRIARNTLYLYVRKFLILCVGLYTSRALLQYLGVDDYGLYGLVGSLIVMFGALRGLFASSIQRFINYEKGRGNNDRINRIFSMGMKIQIWIAIAFFIVVEIAGIIMIPGLNIPGGSRQATYWILQFSILTAIVSILTVPYDAIIIAYERFNAYALFAVIESFLKLGAVLLLAWSPFQPVIYYAGLLSLVSVIIRILNTIYCRREFGAISRFHRIKDKKLFREMSGFAGWQFFGNLGFTLCQSGVNFILNLFGGVVVNAARTVALQFTGLLETFTQDLNVSFKPQIIDSWSRGDRDRFFSLCFSCWRITFFLVVIIAFPAYILAPSLLELWLGNVPQHAAVFVKALILFTMVRSFHSVFDTMFKAEGHLKAYQTTEVVCQLTVLPLSWLVLKLGAPFQSVFYVMTLVEIANLAIISLIARPQVGLSLRKILEHIVWRVVLCSAILAVLAFAVSYLLPVKPKFSQILTYFIVLFVTSICIAYVSLLNRHERTRLKHVVISKILR